MVFLWFMVIGVCLIVLAGYYGIKYRHGGFDQTRFDKWRLEYLKRYPDAEDEEAEEYFRTHKGAPLGIWLKDKFLKEIDNGKKLSWICGGIGAILMGFASIF